MTCTNKYDLIISTTYVNNKTWRHLNYPRAILSSPKVNLRSVVGKTTLGSFWCFSRAHGGLLGGSHTTDCSNETSDQLLSPMKPHTTDTHFIQSHRRAFHETLCWKWLFSWGRASFFHHTDMVFIFSSILTHRGVCESH